MCCEWHKLISRIFCQHFFERDQQDSGDKRELLYFKGLWYAEGVWVMPGTQNGSWNIVMNLNK